MTIDKEHFAPEPSEWEKWWVNLWHGGEMPIDQCRFWHRRPTAYTIQPIAMTLYWIGKVMVSLLLTGLILLAPPDRWPHLGRIFQPWKYNPFNVIEDTEPRAWYNRRQWMFTPLAWIGALVMAKLLLLVSHHGRSSWWLLLGTASLVIISASITLFLILAADAAIVRRAAKVMIAPAKPKSERPRPTVAERRQQLLTAYESEFAPLLCQPGVRASLDSLPPEKRSLTLRFNAFKTKVCRPFAS